MTAIAVRKYKDKIVILADSQTFTLLPNGTKIKDDRGHECQRLIWKKENFNISRLSYHPKHEVITYGWKKGAAHQWNNDRSQTDVLEFSRNKNAVHPTQKPIELLSYLIMNSSKQNEFILDLFLGSGSTLIACEQTNRNCYGQELDEKYCDVIVRRYINYMTKEKKDFKIKRNGEELDISIFNKEECQEE